MSFRTPERPFESIDGAVDVADVWKLRAQGLDVALINLHGGDESDGDAIEGARSLPAGALEDLRDASPRGATVLLCATGVLARRLVHELRSKGDRSVYFLRGGRDAWRAARMGGGSGSAGALRHDRQTHLPEFGIDGQERLARARVLVVGAGGLGSPVALYLAAAGVGTLAIADDDHVELSNLHRQVLHDTCRIGQPKTESAAARIAALDPAVQVERLNVRLTESNAADIVPRYSIVVDCTDSIESRHAINRAALGSGVPWVYGAVHRWEGQVSTFARRAGTHHDTRSMASDLPCYRCLYPSRAQVDSCDGGGTVGSLCGIVGSVQATEALKLLLGVGEPLFGVLWTYDGLRARSASYRYARSETCPACAR